MEYNKAIMERILSQAKIFIFAIHENIFFGDIWCEIFSVHVTKVSKIRNDYLQTIFVFKVIL